MSEVMQDRVRLIGRWLNRLRFKTVWKQHMSDELDYSQFKHRVFKMVNDVRELIGSDKYDYDKFDNGWQWRNVGHENYDVAYDEMVNLIFGWW